jgi:hypothetical protein
MLDLMHDGEPYGHLTAGGEPITIEQLARMVGVPLKKARAWFKELSDRKVFSRTENGVIYSRRMVRDEHIRNVRAEAGKKGGNPKLTGGHEDKGEVKPLVNQTPNQSTEQIPTPASAVAVASAVPSFQPPAIAGFIGALPEDQDPTAWRAIIDGWKNGLGLERGVAATAEDIATGLSEYLARADRDFSVVHVKSFVERARRNRLRAVDRAPAATNTARAEWLYTVITEGGFTQPASWESLESRAARRTDIPDQPRFLKELRALLPMMKELREANKFTKDKLVARIAAAIAPIQPERAA